MVKNYSLYPYKCPDFHERFCPNFEQINNPPWPIGNRGRFSNMYGLSSSTYLTCVKSNWLISNLPSESECKYSNRTWTIAGSPVSRPPPSYSEANLWITHKESLFAGFNRRLVSSVGRAPVCCAGGPGLEPQTGPTLRVLKNNWGECAAFVIISANG